MLYPADPTHCIWTPCFPSHLNPELPTLSHLRVYVCLLFSWMWPWYCFQNDNLRRWRSDRKRRYDRRPGDDHYSPGELLDQSGSLYFHLICLFSVCESWKPWDGEEGMHDPVDQDGQVLSNTKIIPLFSSIKLFRSGTTGGLNEHFRTVLRVLLENLEDSEGR